MINKIILLFSLTQPTIFTATVSNAVCKINGQIVPCEELNGAFGMFNNLFGILFPIMFVAMFGLMLLMMVSMWKIYKKAGQPGWASLIPIYNIVKLLEIVKKPDWWVLLYFVPFVNLIVALIIGYNLVISFGKGTGFYLGTLILPFVFIPVLAFGKAQYVGGSQNMNQPTSFGPQL